MNIHRFLSFTEFEFIRGSNWKRGTYTSHRNKIKKLQFLKEWDSAIHVQIIDRRVWLYYCSFGYRSLFCKKIRNSLLYPIVYYIKHSHNLLNSQIRNWHIKMPHRRRSTSSSQPRSQLYDQTRQFKMLCWL